MSIRTNDPASVSRAVETIWYEVLGGETGPAGTTFFELGGESIKAVRLTSRIAEEIGVEIEVGDLFEEDPDLTHLTRSVFQGLEGSGDGARAEGR